MTTLIDRKNAFPILARAVLKGENSFAAQFVAWAVIHNETYERRRGRPFGTGHEDGDALMYMDERVGAGALATAAAREAVDLGLAKGASREAVIRRLVRKFRMRRRSRLDRRGLFANFE